MGHKQIDPSAKPDETDRPGMHALFTCLRCISLLDVVEHQILIDVNGVFFTLLNRVKANVFAALN